MLTSENKLIKEGRHVGLDFYDLLIEEALIDPRRNCERLAQQVWIECALGLLGEHC